jgi:hypothetical protein
MSYYRPTLYYSIPDRLMAGRLVLVQVIGVRIPVREPENPPALLGDFLFFGGIRTGCKRGAN